MLALWWSLASGAEPAAPSDGAALLAAYEAVRVPLVSDRLDGAREAARALAADATAPPEVKGAAQRVADAAEMAAVRAAFGELSRALVSRFEATGMPEGVKVYHCPMAPAYGYWLQGSAGIANPYMGTSMPTCGEGTSFKAAAKAAAEAP